MKKFTPIVICILTAALLCGSLTGCSAPSFDCSGYVQVILDANYKGDYETSAILSETAQDEIAASYEEFIEHETQVMLRFFGITQDDVIPEDLIEELRTLMQALCSLVSYTVYEADQEGTVTVEIYQMTVYSTLYPDVLALNQDFTARNQAFEFSDATDEEFTRTYLEPMIALVAAYIEEPTYAEDAVTVTVTVTQDEDGSYTISEDDIYSLYTALISYSLS